MEDQSIGVIDRVFSSYMDIEKFEPDYRKTEVIELFDSDDENRVDSGVSNKPVASPLQPQTLPTDKCNVGRRRKSQVKDKLNNYGFIEDNGSMICLLCGVTYFLKSKSLKPHYVMKHSNVFKCDKEKTSAIQQSFEEFNKCKALNDTSSWLDAIRAKSSKVKPVKASDIVDILDDSKSGAPVSQFSASRSQTQTNSSTYLHSNNKESSENASSYSGSLASNLEGKHTVILRNDTLTAKEKRLAVESSYMLSQLIAKSGRPFSDGEFIKDAFISCAEILFCDLPNKKKILDRLNSLPTSENVLELRYLEIASTFKNLRTTSLKEAPAFSLAIELLKEGEDEGETKIIMVIRFCGSDFIFEELCDYKTFEYEPSGSEILQFVLGSFKKLQINPVGKLFSVITDNSSVFVESIDGFLTLLEGEVGREVLKYHCLIDQERLISDISDENLLVVMDSVKRVLKFAMSNSTKIEAIFRPKLEEIGIKSYSKMGWLGKGQVLSSFVEHLPEIKKLIHDKKYDFPELTDLIWLNLLMYLTDITWHLNDLESQCQGRTLYDLYEHWKVFIMRIKALISDVSTNSYQELPFLKKFYDQHKISTGESLHYTELLFHEFSERLDSLYAIEALLPFLVDPHKVDLSQFDLNRYFSMLDLKLLKLQSAEFKKCQLIRDKFINLRYNICKYSSDKGNDILHCWTALPDKFMCMKNIAFTLLSAFGSVVINEKIRSLVVSPINPEVQTGSTNILSRTLPKDVTNYEPAIKRLCLISQMEG